MKVGAELQKSS